jgi:hypothetical protein
MRLWGGAAVAVVVSACAGEPGAPAPSAALPELRNAAGITAGVAAVESVFATPSWRSYAALSPLFRIPGTAPLGAMSQARACAPHSVVPPAPPAPRAPPAPESLALLAAGFIPDSAARYVFYYEPATNSYIRSADTTAPGGGVRFLLYRVDSAGRPLVPLLGDGAYDLIDQSIGADLILRAVVSGNAGAGAAYTMTTSGRRDNYRSLIDGSVTDGLHTLTFTDSMIRDFVAVTITARVRDGAGGVTYTLTATRSTIDAFDNYYDVDFTVANAIDTARVYGSITTYCLIATTALTIAVQGVDYAQVEAGSFGPVIVRLDHQPLGDSQALALWSLIRLQDQLFKRLEAFFAPARQLLAP